MQNFHRITAQVYLDELKQGFKWPNLVVHVLYEGTTSLIVVLVVCV